VGVCFTRQTFCTSIVVKMKILTWNILASEWVKKSDYPSVKRSVLFDRKGRFNRICALIREADPDIILLQEVMQKEYSKLVAEFEETYLISGLKKMVWYNTTSAESGNVTLLRRSRFSSDKLNHIPQEYGLYTQCEYMNKSCDIFNIHLDDQSNTKRHTQWAHLQSIMRSSSRANIIAGDFNHPYRKDSKLYHIPGYTVHNLCSTYYIERKMNIDNILTKGMFRPKNAQCALYPTTVEDGFRKYGSDHLPVLVEVDIVTK
jgi:endonuclease/exonuclease/phosphatase family metal-dependent hydrolase